ncbi:hypothetical protein POM88_013850 [Heracleum sosnowskyi]|uniref:MULE transposase domain-containing protein n=1 Tax=Heracleum sosnowskyi TaxID=360622 RepID=A0AAD8IZC7_9APIA|nr:hypothetical protein POM88_013850 [Heracleum sosnowskyi]
MDNILILVQHSGHWDESLRYLNFEVFGLLIPKNCNYTNLVSMICNELKKEMPSNISYNNSNEVSKENVEDYVDYAEEISRQMVEMSPEVTTEDEIIEINKDDVINNKRNQELSVLQVYKDKETLQMVLATQDAGAKIFPLAFGVVDSENDMSLEWFFEKFRKSYGRREYMVTVSDRHESIIKGANKIYPEVPNVFYIFHLLGNIKTKFKKNLKKIKYAFLSAANAYSVC